MRIPTLCVWLDWVISEIYFFWSEHVQPRAGRIWGLSVS